MKLIAQHDWGNPLISINKFQMPDPSAAKKDDNPAPPGQPIAGLRLNGLGKITTLGPQMVLHGIS